MKKIKIILPVLAFLAGTFTAYADGNDSLRINMLQKELNNVRDSIASLQSSQGKVVTLLEKAERFSKEPLWMIFSKMGAFSIAVIALIFLFFWTLNKVSPNWYVVLIQRLVERNEGTNVLIRKKRILLLKHKGEKPDSIKFVQNLLEEFTVVEEIEIGTTYVAPSKQYDIVFANFEEGFEKDKHQADLHKYIDTPAVGTALFALVPPGSWDYRLNPELNKKVSIANVRAQVYGNLISMLKYHDLTTPKW